MKNAFVFLVVTILSCTAYAQHQGAGLRLGEPLGFTYKRYLPGNKAFEIVVGTAPTDWSERYYKNSFERRYKDEDEVDTKVKQVVYLQGRYLFHNPIPTEGLEGKFDWYWGVGILLKTARVEYRYRDELPATKEVFKRKRTDLDFGPDLIGGVEYTFEDVPVSIFGELDLLLELRDRTTVRLLGGFGARINF